MDSVFLIYVVLPPGLNPDGEPEDSGMCPIAVALDEEEADAIIELWSEQDSRLYEVLEIPVVREREVSESVLGDYDLAL